MQRYAFKMFLNPGCADEYARRHDNLWPALQALLTDAGIGNYSIHLDPETDCLFAYLERRADHAMEALPAHPVVRQWWDHMRDIMQTHPDGAPVVVDLVPMFHFRGIAG